MSEIFVTSDPYAFAAKLRELPKKLHARRNEYVFELTASIHRFLADTKVTPRDTGYLANGLGIDPYGNSPSNKQAPRPANAEKDSFPPPQMNVTALARALRSGQPFVIGYQASYAPYVEDRRHMMKRAKARMGTFHRDALTVVKDRDGAGMGK